MMFKSQNGKTLIRQYIKGVSVSFFYYCNHSGEIG